MSCQSLYIGKPDQLDLDIKRGITWVWNLQYFNGSNNNQPVDLSGYTGLCTFVNAVTGSPVVSPTVTIVDGPNGKWSVSLTKTQTEALPLDTLINYDVFLTAPDFTVSCQYEGSVVVYPNYATP